MAPPARRLACGCGAKEQIAELVRRLGIGRSWRSGSLFPVKALSGVIGHSYPEACSRPATAHRYSTFGLVRSADCKANSIFGQADATKFKLAGTRHGAWV